MHRLMAVVDSLHSSRQFYVDYQTIREQERTERVSIQEQSSVALELISS